MRFIIYGVGAIGGAVAAALALRGNAVVGIARGKQLAAIQSDGLLFRTPHLTERARFDCVASPREIEFGSEDVIILTMKSQHTSSALLDLRDAGADAQPIFCAQNGVANEPEALRIFPNVYGIMVIMASDYLVAGEVNVFGTPAHGIFEIGRYPGGTDEVVDAVCAALQGANIAAFASATVMHAKYGKLLLNTGNIIEAVAGMGIDGRLVRSRVRDEAETVYRAAGIAWRDVGASDGRRRQFMQIGEIADKRRSGGSSMQSLSRASGSLETDYLNGQIVLLGRLHDVPTPFNVALCRLGFELLATGSATRTTAVDYLERLLLLSGDTE